jgi:hypothetical protein
VFTSSLILAAGASEARAYLSCSPTPNGCDRTASVTSSFLQIGGQGSRSSEGPRDPARLNDGTIAEAHYAFTFDRATGRLTVTATNTTSTKATLTGIFFNAPPEVTGMRLVSHDGGLNWKLLFDADRTDGVVDSHPFHPYLRGDGFGLFTVVLSNKEADTWKTAGEPNTEILARWEQRTFVLEVAGDLQRLTACSFTSVGSLIPPGDKIVLGLARFQGGQLGGVGYIGPCEGGALLVHLASFGVAPESGRVTVAWETAAEIDNLGFNVLRREVRRDRTRWLNAYLVPALGSGTSGASYLFVDTTAVDGVEYEYSVEDVDVDGFNTIHASKRAVPNPPSPEIRLVEPAYNAAAGDAIRMSWTAPGRAKCTVEIAADPTFPPSRTLRIPSGYRPGRDLTAREVDQVRRLAAGGDGGVYWRVRGRGGRGAVLSSETYFLEVTP